MRYCHPDSIDRAIDRDAEREPHHLRRHADRTADHLAAKRRAAFQARVIEIMATPDVEGGAE